MGALFRFVQIEFRAAHDDVDLVTDIAVDDLFEIEDFRLSVAQSEENNAVGSLQRGMFVQKI